MRAPSPLPVAGSGTVFLTEGGSETEIMYRHGFELPEFEDAIAEFSYRGQGNFIVWSLDEDGEHIDLLAQLMH